MTSLAGHLTLQDSLARLPGTKGERFAEMFQHGTLSLEFYAPRGADPQKPHTRDELYVVIAGSGQFWLSGRSEAFSPGDVLFAPAGAEHRFADFSSDLAVWVVFYGPEGGEKFR